MMVMDDRPDRNAPRPRWRFQPESFAQGGELEERQLLSAMLPAGPAAARMTLANSPYLTLTPAQAAARAVSQLPSRPPSAIQAVMLQNSSPTPTDTVPNTPSQPTTAVVPTTSLPNPASSSTTPPMSQAPSPTPADPLEGTAARVNPLLRIERLPFFLQSLDPNRILPETTISSIQTDLGLLTGTLNRRPFDQLRAFNTFLRQTLRFETLSPEAARTMNVAFGRVLDAAGADPDLTQRLQTHLDDLARATVAQSRKSAFVAANDYAIVTQLALGVGRPEAARALQLRAWSAFNGFNQVSPNRRF